MGCQCSKEAVLEKIYGLEDRDCLSIISGMPILTEH